MDYISLKKSLSEKRENLHVEYKREISDSLELAKSIAAIAISNPPKLLQPKVKKEVIESKRQANLYSTGRDLLVECPTCHGKVDIDSDSVKKEEDGLHLIVTCPHGRCRKKFILQRVRWVREKLKADYAFLSDDAVNEKRVRISPG